MKIYMITGYDGTTYEPLYRSKRAATKARFKMGLKDPRSTFVRTLLVIDPPITKRTVVAK